MSFKRIVQWLEAGAAAAAIVFVIMLFAAGSGGGGSASAGAQIFSANCARCHGVDGGGGLGPALANVVAEKYPDIEDQIGVVTGGKGTMPAFGNELTKEQIREVVEYTRTELGK